MLLGFRRRGDSAGPLVRLHAVERLLALLRREIAGIDEGEAAFSREAVRRRPGHHHDVAAVENGARRLDGVADPSCRDDRAGCEVGAVHDGGIELVIALRIEGCTMASVEMGRVLQHDHRSFHGIEGAPAVAEEGPTGPQRPSEIEARLLPRRGFEMMGGQHAAAAVDHQCSGAHARSLRSVSDA